MWGSNVTREHVLQKITLLAMLGGVREGTKEHELIPRPGRASCVTIEQEGEIVSNLAVLASRRKNSKAVIHDIESLFRQVIMLDFYRICTRLRLGRKYQIEASPIMLLRQALYDNSIAGIEEPKMIALRENTPQPLDKPTAYQMIEEVTRLAHNLNQSSWFSVALNKSSKFSSSKLASLGDSVAKLGQYYKAASELVLAARRKRCRIFRKIRVESFQICVPEHVRIPTQPGSALPLVDHLLQSLETSKLLHCLGSKFAVDAALVNRLNSERAGIKLHAEIKLLFYYESCPAYARPRVICTNKSACYLCDLFFRIHGQFQLPRTFGKMNERWILPDWLHDIPPSRIPALRNAVEQFSTALDSQIRLASKNMKRQPDPIESSVGISAYWSCSTVDRAAWSQPIPSPDTTATVPTGYPPAPESLEVS
ncbi:hypothetical protein B0O99DRAFT_516281 [Bisporella sp. PMI_857]|nr:hypothetical protein B0O99DRAFT_516281 [Bisporella sp. PMI_857]